MLFWDETAVCSSYRRNWRSGWFKYSERTHLEDMFGHQRLREKKYTAGQIDAKWSPEIEQDFHEWLKQNEDHLPVPKSTIEEILKENKPSN